MTIDNNIKSKKVHKKRTNDQSDNQKSAKKLKKPNTDSNLLDFYWTLASDDPKERLNAAIGLLKKLNELNNEKDWNYAFERLLKGLSSPRGSVRLGFSMALSEVLIAREEFIDVWTYLDMVGEYFQIASNLKGHEERGLHFGTLFALRTLANSPLMLKSSTTIREYERFLDICLEVSQRKVWLRESIFFALCDLIKRLNSVETLGFDFNDSIAITLKKVDENGLTLTSEGAALYLSIDKEIRNECPISGGWKNNDPLATGNLVTLSKALKEVPIEEDEENGDKEKEKERTKLKGNWKPTLHFVWELILNEFVTESKSESNNLQNIKPKSKSKSKADKTNKTELKSNCITFEEFWKVVVDESLFSNSASNERKYWGFEIFALSLKRVSSSNVKYIFSPNFIRCLINQLSQQDRLLNKAAKKVISSIQEVSKERPDISSDLLKSLLQIPNFDTITKSKTISTLTLVVPANELPSLVNTFISIFENPKESEQKAIEFRRQWALDNLLNLVKSRRSEPDSSIWLESIINLLVNFGYFKSEISATSIEQCQSRLNSILSLTVGSPRDDNKSWAYYVLHSIIALENDKELVYDFEGDLLKAKNKSIKTLEKIRKKRSSSAHADTSQLEAFELLFSLVLIQVYSTDTEAASVLDELQMCYNTIIGKSRNEEGVDEDIDASQVLTDIILSFLSRRSALLRKLSETVWGTFSSQITKESLQLLYDVLETKESTQGQEELFDKDDMDLDELEEDGEDEDDGGDDDDDDEDEEDEEDDDDDEEDDEEEDEDDSDEDNDDNDIIKKADKQAQDALAKALGIDHEREDPSSDEEDDDDESMDDEQMMALDEQISGIFRERQKILNANKTPNQKKEALEAKQNMIQFKSRILDLLEIYIKSQPSNPLLLTAIPPLLNLIRITKDVPLGDKAHQLIKNKLCRVKEIPKITSNDIDSTILILTSIHQQATKSPNKSHSLACNQTSVFISKILLSHDKLLAENISSIYASSLTEWMKVSNSKITPALFFDLVNYIASTKSRK